MQQTNTSATTSSAKKALNKNVVESFMAARAVGAPLISITCPDPEVTIRKLQNALVEHNPKTPIIQWDCVRGWKSRTDQGSKAVKDVLTAFDAEPEATKNPIRQLIFAENLPSDSVLFILNTHHRTHQMEKPDFWQALWNLRDMYKGNFRSVVLLSPSITLPIDITGDVFCIDEGLPKEAELLEIVEEITSLVVDSKFDKKNKLEAAQALQGLPPFAAEQAVAMALKPGHIEINEIFDRKRELLNEIPGLKVYDGKEMFTDLGGCNEVKMLLHRIIRGNDPPRVIVFIDEGEKMMAGATHAVGDNTGVSQDFMGTLLSYMEDNESDGTIFVGPTGTAKSALAKAMGNEAKVPTVFLDLGAMKNSLLGASEHRLRYALKIIDSIGHGQVFFIMTSNNISKIPPEFKRRFSSGTFFFDLPDGSEQEAIWKIHTKRYGIDMKQVAEFEHPEWTGAEIRNVCRMAFRQKITLAEASKSIVPVAQSGADTIRQLRKSASGNFLSANFPGTYRYGMTEETAPSDGKRKMETSKE